MTETLAFHTLDVFTDRPFAGNPLAVVLGADGLSTAQMLTLAREFNLSETIFVQRPQDPAHTARVRIFFPTDEIPFAGHPTIGCAMHLACADEDGDFDKVITLEEEAGLVPVTVHRRGASVTAELTAPVLPYAAGQVPETGLLAQALGLTEAEIGPDRPGCQEGGPRFLYLPVQGLDALARARPQEPAWSAACAKAGVDSIYLYVRTGPQAFRCRMFSPTAGIPEDPATGSAAALFAAQLLANGHLSSGTTRLTLTQGVEMGRRSEIGLTVELAEGALTAVRIAGSAVPLSQGRIRRPQAG